MGYLIKNYYGEKKQKTNKQEYQHLFTWKADIAPKWKLIK